MMFHGDCAYFSTIDEESPEEKEVRDTRQCSYLISQRKPLPQKKGASTKTSLDSSSVS